MEAEQLGRAVDRVATRAEQRALARNPYRTIAIPAYSSPRVTPFVPIPVVDDTSRRRQPRPCVGSQYGPLVDLSLEGVFVPVVTPFDPGGDVDLDALAAVVELVLSAGVRGIV